MDDFSIQDERIDRALKELKTINKYLGGISTTKSALKYFTKSKKGRLKILDIGSGSSDNLISAKNKHHKIEILSVDKNLRVLSSQNNQLIKINSDAFVLPFKDTTSLSIVVKLKLKLNLKSSVKLSE